MGSIREARASYSIHTYAAHYYMNYMRPPSFKANFLSLVQNGLKFFKLFPPPKTVCAKSIIWRGKGKINKDMVESAKGYWKIQVLSMQKVIK